LPFSPRCSARLFYKRLNSNLPKDPFYFDIYTFNFIPEFLRDVLHDYIIRSIKLDLSFLNFVVDLRDVFCDDVFSQYKISLLKRSTMYRRSLTARSFSAVSSNYFLKNLSCLFLQRPRSYFEFGKSDIGQAWQTKICLQTFEVRIVDDHQCLHLNLYSVLVGLCFLDRRFFLCPSTHLALRQNSFFESFKLINSLEFFCDKIKTLIRFEDLKES